MTLATDLNLDAMVEVLAMDTNELKRFLQRWARTQRKMNAAEESKFISYYAEHYPNGDREISWVYDYQPWRS